MNEFLTEYNFLATSFLFNIELINDHKISYLNLNKIYDFNNNTVLLLNDRKSHLSLSKVSGKIYSESDIINSMKSDYKFMSMIINYIDIIKALVKPKSLKYVDIIDSGYFESDNPIFNKEIEIKWYMKDDHLEDNKLIITVF